MGCSLGSSGIRGAGESVMFNGRRQRDSCQFLACRYGFAALLRDDRYLCNVDLAERGHRGEERHSAEDFAPLHCDITCSEIRLTFRRLA